MEGTKGCGVKDFPGLVIPFFAGVDYQPSATYQAATGRVEGRLRKGVFLGWAMNPGFDWRKKTYYVVDLADFLGCNLHRRARCEHVKVHIQEVSVIANWDPEAVIEYPLQDTYEWFNSTFEGNITAMAMDPAIFERKKDRKGRLAYDQGLERVEKVPKTEEQRLRRLRRQEKKVERFA